MNYVDHTTSPPDVVAIYNLLGGAEGNSKVIFSAVFEKRTTGEVRHMTAKVGVKKYQAGGELKFRPFNRDLLPVFDMDIMEYRFIPMEGLISLTVGDTVFQFKKPKEKPELDN